jgi:hypothetical protein
MRKNLNIAWLVLGIILSSLQVTHAQQNQKEPLRVLFVGNSFTYYYNLSQVVTAMAESQGVNIMTRQSTVGGSSLEQHWKEEKGTVTRKLLDSLEWDYVVFNNHSLSTINNPERFMEYSMKFAELVRKKGAEPVFMQTWGYKSNPLLIRTIVPSYDRLAELSNTHLVPCGELFAEVRKWRPELELFADDKHPSPVGTYLLGLAFFKYFTGLPTTEINRRIWTEDRNGEKLYLLFMEQTDADFLQQVVDDYTFKFFAGK